MMRFLLTKRSREALFNSLKEKYDSKTFKELANKLNIPFKTLQKYKLGNFYIPGKIIPTNANIKIIEKKEDNWGQIKGGGIGGNKSIEHLKKLWGEKKYFQIRSEMGKKNIKKILEKYGANQLTKMAIAGRIKARQKRSKELEARYGTFFTNEHLSLDITKINYSSYDKMKNIKFPTEMSSQLAEEIGIHLGDGCLSFNRKYFSVKTNKKEEDYMVDFLFPLYKRLYNLDLKLMKLQSVVGFEMYSKALFEFKNKVLGIPYGEKIHRIQVPESVLSTKNKEVYRAFIRGIFDTDGCVNIVKSKGNYPIITFTIKSEKLIEQIGDMLRKLGFIPYVGKYIINLNGKIMLKKWIKEISSNNPKNLAKLRQANS